MSNRELHQSFHFRVKFSFAGAVLQRLGSNLAPISPSVDGDPSVDIHFQSVSGLEVGLQTETISEGGQNLYDYKVPLRTECSNLILKRGYSKNSVVVDWCKFNFDNPLGIVLPIPILVELLNEKHEPTITWNVQGAFPLKWSFDELNAGQSALLIESLELNCNSIHINDV